MKTIAISGNYERQVEGFVEQLEGAVEVNSRNFSAIIVIKDRIYHISSEELSVGKAERLIKTKKMRKLASLTAEK